MPSINLKLSNPREFISSHQRLILFDTKAEEIINLIVDEEASGSHTKYGWMGSLRLEFVDGYCDGSEGYLTYVPHVVDQELNIDNPESYTIKLSTSPEKWSLIQNAIIHQQDITLTLNPTEIFEAKFPAILSYTDPITDEIRWNLQEEEHIPLTYSVMVSSKTRCREVNSEETKAQNKDEKNHKPVPSEVQALNAISTLDSRLRTLTILVFVLALILAFK